MRRQRGNRRRTEKRLLNKYLMLVGSIVGVFIIFASLYVFAFLRPADASTGLKGQDYTDNSGSVKPAAEENKKTRSNFLIAPKITTFLVMGTDKTNLLTDVIILGFFNSETGNINLVNIPRDTYTTVSPDLRRRLEDEGKWLPSAMKINELHSYAGTELGDGAIKQHLEEELDITVDYTANVSLEAFRQIVDIVGPITMEIPSGGLYYHDPDQNLTISIPGGVQNLDGEMAEGLVRFRSTYKRGDLQRIEVQQEFLKQLFKQTLSKDTLMNNATEILITAMEYVKTDFRIENAPKYLPYISKLSADKFVTTTLPGEPQYISNGQDNISYYRYDTVAGAELLDNILYPEKATGHAVNKIQILNGGTDDKTFNEFVTKMESDGYEVTVGGQYSGVNKNNTRIILRDITADVTDLKTYFKTALVEEDKTLDNSYDSIIITGIKE